MHPDIHPVASAFFVVAAVLGLVSLAGLAFSLTLGVQLMRTPSQNTSMPVKNPDAVLITIYGMARVIGAMAGVVGAIGRIAAVALGMLSIMGIGLSTLLYFTGHGLLAREAWARETATVASGGVLALALLATVALPGWRRLPALATAAVAAYALAALWRGYAMS